MSNIEDYSDPEFEVWTELAYMVIVCGIVAALFVIAVHNIGIHQGWI